MSKNRNLLIMTVVALSISASLLSSQQPFAQTPQIAKPVNTQDCYTIFNLISDNFTYKYATITVAAYERDVQFLIFTSNSSRTWDPNKFVLDNKPGTYWDVPVSSFDKPYFVPYPPKITNFDVDRMPLSSIVAIPIFKTNRQRYCMQSQIQFSYEKNQGAANQEKFFVFDYGTLSSSPVMATLKVHLSNLKPQENTVAESGMAQLIEEATAHAKALRASGNTTEADRWERITAAAKAELR